MPPRALLEYNLPEEQDEFTAASQGEKLRDAIDTYFFLVRDRVIHAPAATTWREVFNLFMTVIKDCELEVG